MKKLILLCILVVSSYAEIKVMFYGTAVHKNTTYNEKVEMYDTDTGQKMYTIEKKNKYNTDNRLIGLEYKKRLWSASAVTYQNSFDMRTNAFYISKYWPYQDFELKLSGGLASGYSMKRWEGDRYIPLLMPSIAFRKEFMEIEVGTLGTAFIMMTKICF